MQLVAIKIEPRGGISLKSVTKKEITILEEKIKEDKVKYSTNGKWYGR